MYVCESDSLLMIYTLVSLFWPGIKIPWKQIYARVTLKPCVPLASSTVAKKEEVHEFHWTGVHLGQGGASRSLESHFSGGFLFFFGGGARYFSTWQGTGWTVQPPDSYSIKVYSFDHDLKKQVNWSCTLGMVVSVGVMYCICLVFNKSLFWILSLNSDIYFSIFFK